MRKIFITLAIAFMAMNAANAQVVRDGKNFTKVATPSAQDQKSGFTFTESNGQVYDIYVGKTGACYILKTSKKTGNLYRKYLGEEISAQICKELGIAYQPKNKE